MLEPRREYELTVSQEPKQARICGVGVDRRPIDPPPIIQLRVVDHNTRQPPSPANPDAEDPDPNYAHSFLQNPYYFMFASLAKPDDDTELHWLKDGETRCTTRCTTGSVVSSLYHLKSTENRIEDAGFFVFPDLSVCIEGTYRLKLSLFEVVCNTVRHCKSIYSALFYVYTPNKNSGIEESTPLLCSLIDQGIKIRIRKDIRARKRPIAALAPPADAAPPNSGKNRKVAQEQTRDDPHAQRPRTALLSQPASSNAASGPAAVKRARHGTLAGPLHFVSGSASAASPGSDTVSAHIPVSANNNPGSPIALAGLPAWPASSMLDPMLGVASTTPGRIGLSATSSLGHGSYSSGEYYTQGLGPGHPGWVVSLGPNTVRYPEFSYASGALPVPVPGWGHNGEHAHGLGQQEVIHLAPLRHAPRGVGGASTSSSSPPSSPALPSVSGSGGYPMIRPSRAPLEQDGRGGKENVLNIGNIISDGV